MLNQDLDGLAQWLYDHKLTLNVSKSKLMLIGGPKKLNTLEEFTLKIKEKELGSQLLQVSGRNYQ